MRKFNTDIILKKARTYKSRRVQKICMDMCTGSVVDYKILFSIYLIESFFRPVGFRMAEYVLTFGGSMRCLLINKEFKNYTIGPCQLGLATVLNYHGANIYQHQKKIKINSIKQIIALFSVISIQKSLRILKNWCNPVYKRAKEIFPRDIDNQLYYIGEQYNGRFSYGLMLSEVYNKL